MIDGLLKQVAELERLVKANLHEKRSDMEDRAVTREQLARYGVSLDKLTDHEAPTK